MFAIEVASMAPLASAYAAAGYREGAWAPYNASKLAKMPEVAARIAELQSEFAERAGIRAEYIQRKLLPLVESDPRGLFESVVDAAGVRTERLKSITQLPSGLAAAIQKIRLDSKTGQVTGIDLHDKNAVGGTLLRSVGGLIDRHEIDDKRLDGEHRCLAELSAELLQRMGLIFERYAILLPPESVVHQQHFRDLVQRAIFEVVEQLADPAAADAEVERRLDELRQQQRENRPRIQIHRSLPRGEGA
jgi:hypothetical protein